MSGSVNTAVPGPHPGQRRKWMWIKLAGIACLLSWLALAIGIGLKIGTGTMLVLATLAAVVTKGTIWLTALLGVSVSQARRRTWEKIRLRAL